MSTSPLLSRRLLTTAAALSLATGAAQAQERQPRPVGEFQQVASSGGIDVYLTQGPTAAVVVEAAPEALPHIVTEVQNGALSIHWEQNYSLRGLSYKLRNAKVYITAPRLSGLTLSGGADGHGQTPILADDFRIETSGGSDVTLTLQAKTLRANASGGSDLTLSGQVERQELSLSGGSDYHGFGLQSTTATIEASGGADADAWVEGELAASASGGSDLRYKGAGRVTSVRASGSSGVRHVGQ